MKVTVVSEAGEEGQSGGLATGDSTTGAETVTGSSTPVPKRPPLDGVEWLARAAVVSTVVLTMVALAFVFAFRDYVPTAIQKAVTVWGLWGVVASAFAVDAVTAPEPRCWSWALASGWLGCAVGAAVAMLLFPRYPAAGPHEIVVALILMLSPAAQACLVGLRASRQGRSWRKPAAAIASAFIVFAVAPFSMAISAEELALPLASYPVEHHGRYDFAGSHVSYLRCPLPEAALGDYVRDLGLEGRPVANVGEIPHLKADVAAAARWSFVPERMAPPRTARLWFDPDRETHNTPESWCWTDVAWDAGTVWVSRGCGWM